MFKKENLRKNFLRVKQNIDQNLGRAEQSKVLTEDQQENEKRVEVVKHAFQNIAKRAGAVLQASGTDFDKKLKKLPEMSLGHAMVESAQSLGTDTLLGSVCQLCGDCQMNLAREQVQYETTVEQDFITPLQSVVDVDIPSIMKFRKALSKSILDMDSAKTRLNQVVRQSQVPGVNMANAAAKADVIKEECEEATLKMENIKDSLSIELCNFASKECEHSNRLLSFLESQANYHKRALEIIEDCIPQMKLAIKNSPAKPCYGMPLEEHLHLMCRDVAIVLEACIVTLLETGMEEEGLFRIAGSALKLKKLKASFDAHVVDMEEFSSDPHTVAGALKQYLRELPEPLLTYDLYEDFMQTATLPQDQRLQALWTVINRLPKANYNNFRYLVKFLAKLAEKSDVNRMKPSNIAIVIGPNLLWSEKSNTPNMMTTGTVSAIIEAIVTHADWFFPGAFDFHLTGHDSSPKPSKEPGVPVNNKPEAKSPKENAALNEKVAISNNTSPKGPGKSKDEVGSGNGDRIKVLPLVQSVVELSIESNEAVKSGSDEAVSEGDSSSDEGCIYLRKVEMKSVSSEMKSVSSEMNANLGKARSDDEPRGNSPLSTKKKDSCVAPPGGTNTGDYDNILFSLNLQNPIYRSGTFSRANTLGFADRRGSADNVLSYGKHVPAPVPPTRPSRMTKRSLPLVSEHNQGYPTFSRTVSQTHSVGMKVGQGQGPEQPSDKYLTGSTPNINTLTYGRPEDDEVYMEYRAQLWNRPSQKFDFNSLKRGSDPCIMTPPPSQFNASSSQRPLKLSRSQLPTPPKPGNIPRSQSSPQGEMPAPERSQGQPLMTRSQQGATPVDKSFHQDTYDTAFALTSLGAGSKSTDYLTRVRAMWDDRHQQNTPKFSPTIEKPVPGIAAAATSESNKEAEHSCPTPKTNAHPEKDSVDLAWKTRGTPSQTSPVLEGIAKSFRERQQQASPMLAHREEIDFNIGYTYEDSQDGTQVQPEKSHNSTETTQSQSSQQPTTQNSVQSPSPGVSQGPTCYSSSSSLPVLPESPDSTSPLQRRLTRKPAPPPPPDRPYTVNVTATTASVFKPGGSTNSIASVSSSSNGGGGGGGGDSAKGNNSNHIHTSQKTAPLASPESPTEQHKSPVGQQEKDKQKLPSNPSERPLIQPHHRPDQAPPERPKVPPVLNPPVAARGHQRSVSAGALISQKVGVFEGSGSSGVPNADKKV